jgi:phosphoribosyl 1,2-cyclic phosphodiesterase
LFACHPRFKERQMENTFKVKFWGVRGSYPVPGPATARVGGNTACVEVTAGKQTIIIDAGTGIINLGKALTKR